MKKIEELIKTYIQSAHVMQLATISGGTPWICTVHYSAAQSLKLYWMSSRSRQHSKDIQSDANAAVAILIDESKIICVHMKGKAYEVLPDEAETANDTYSKKYGYKPARLKEAMAKDIKLRAYYKFVPELIVLFDEQNFPDNPRQELALLNK